jgi:putative membrane protein
MRPLLAGTQIVDAAANTNKITAVRGEWSRVMKRLLALLALASPLTVWAPLTALADSPDASFYKHAAQGGIAEVEAGNLAQQKSTNPKVKDFGAMMVKDHTAANNQLTALAGSKGVSLPASSSVGQMATKAKLEVLSGETFDKSYIKGQIKAHEDTAALFQKEIASGKDADAKAFAKETLPTIRSHLKAIRAIAASAGISK